MDNELPDLPETEPDEDSPQTFTPVADKTNFYLYFEQIQELVQKGEEIPIEILPEQHPLWIVAGMIMGLSKATPKQKTETGITAESIKKLETSIEKMLKNRESAKPQENNKPFYAVMGLVFCCILLFVGLIGLQAKNNKKTDAYFLLAEELRTCEGPHVTKLQDGSCTLRIEETQGGISIPSWKPIK